MNLYGLMSLNNEIECDKKESFQFLTDVANSGHEKAIYNLGVEFYQGYGIEADREKAIELFKMKNSN